MDEKNLFENENQELETEAVEENQEAIEETTDEAVEEPENTEQTFEEASEDDFSEEAEEAYERDIEESGELLPEITKEPKSKKGLKIAVVIIAVVAIIGAVLAYDFLGNKYNRMGYLDISGMTLDEMCQEIGAGLDEFKEAYGLPEDMPGDTNFNTAYNVMPVKVIAAMNYTDFATLKESFKIPDTYVEEEYTILGKIKSVFVKNEKPIDENTPWGIVQGEMTLEYAVGAENLEEFKKEFGYGDEITLETKWKEVRPAVEKASLKQRLEEEKAAAEAEKNQGEGAEGEGEAQDPAQPAEDTAAPLEGEADAEAAPAEDAAE